MSSLKVGLCKALTKDVLDSINIAGVKHVVDFVSINLEELSKKTGVSYKELVAIRRVVLAQHSAFPVTGADLYDQLLSSVTILSTGCSSVDHLLDGGIYTAEVTEIIGPAAAGKTQVCLSTALTVAKESNLNVVYIDTGGSFDVQRLQEILEARQVPEKECYAILERIRCHHIFDIFELLTELHNIKTSLSHQTEQFDGRLKLVILDCVTSVISPILGGPQTDGHGYMMHVAQALKCLAVEFHIAVLVINNSVSDEHEDVRPSMGRSWHPVPHTRLALSRTPPQPSGAGDQADVTRTARLIKSARQIIGQRCRFWVTDTGLSEAR